MTQAILGSPLVMMFIILAIVLVPAWRIVRRSIGVAYAPCHLLCS